MSRLDSICDDIYLNLNLNTEMDLPQNRETLLHFFEAVQRHYPKMRHFYQRERGEFVLEEEKEAGSHRWMSVDARRVCAGFINPPQLEDALKLHQTVLDKVPYALSLSTLDCESLNLMYGFDFNYQGNHNELLVNALGVMPGFERLLEVPGANVVSHEPAIVLALDDECRTQCRLNFETRTTAVHLRTREFPEEQLSVYFTIRRYGSLEPGESYPQVIAQLHEQAWKVLDGHIIDNILKPLRQTIAIR